MIQYKWHNLSELGSTPYSCGHCGTSMASEKGYFGGVAGAGGVQARIMICHQCTCPTFINYRGVQIPGPAFGDVVNDISDVLVEKIYNEARFAYAAGAYTGAVLCCRKLLMHIAVAKGAAAGGSFLSYVEYMRDHHYVPPDAVPWVDHIRKKGNEANHEIVLADKDEAEELISFCEMLLKVIFEFPAAVKRKVKADS